jgi:hypothetical protein
MSIGIGTVLALFAPNDVLARYGSIAEVVGVFRRVVPSIDNLCAVSAFPQVCQFVCAINWALIPIQIAVFFVGRTFHPNFRKLGSDKYFVAFVLLVQVGCCAYLYFFWNLVPADLSGNMLHERVYRAISHSRVGLGFWVGLFTTFIALTLSLALSFVAQIVPMVFQSTIRR